MRLIVTDPRGVALASQMGSALIQDSPERLWGTTMVQTWDSLVYLRFLEGPDPASNMGITDDQMAKELLLVSTMSLMSDMWDIPFVCVVRGGDTLRPMSELGVFWGLVEDQVRAKKSSVLRMNGLFGKLIPNDAWAALMSDKPRFNDEVHISPISDRQLVGVIDDTVEWMTKHGGIETLVGWGSMTWFGFASQILENCSPFKPLESNRRQIKGTEGAWGIRRLERARQKYLHSNVHTNFDQSWATSSDGMRAHFWPLGGEESFYQFSKLVVEAEHQLTPLGQRIHKGESNAWEVSKEL